LNLPARVIPLLAFAEHLEQKGDAEQAAVIYYQALDNIGNEKVVRLDYFLKVSKFFREQKRYEEALDVILKAIILFPASADLRVAAGNLYEDMGLIHRAAEEYRLALVIDPGGTEARRQLGILQQDTD
jgi:tetratricopeptide (TPR) repeat protein